MHVVSKCVGRRPDLALLIARVILGAAFLGAGIVKYQIGVSNIAGFFGGAHIPFPLFSAWLVTIVETVGGIALILGVATEIVATLLTIIMIVAIISATWSMGFLGSQAGPGYSLNLVYMASLIIFMLMGAGKYSLDALCKCKMCKGTSPEMPKMM